MNAFDDMDGEELLDHDVQMIIQESCQKKCHLPGFMSEAQQLAEVIEQGDILALQEFCHLPTAFGQVDKHGWYPLHRAVVQPLVPLLKMVLYASFRLTLEEKTPDGETFLTLAVKAGLVENVRMLLDYGASPHTTNCKNESPLLLAVRAGSLPMASSLIAQGARVRQVCLKKWSAMHEASKIGCVPIMDLLLLNGGQVAETDQHGVTPLGIAAEYSHPEVLELLIKHGADVNAQAPNGDSVLYDATGSGNPDCVNILLRHGANPNIPNLSCLLPIHQAAYEGHLVVLRILIPITTRRALRLSGQSPIHSASDGGRANCLEVLLQNGFDVNMPLASHISENYGDMRRSPLYFAVSNGDTKCTEILLRSGANPNLDPLCCLLVAVRSGCYKIVKLLLAAKADVNCYFNMVNNTIFPTALQYCLKDEVMMRLLLNNGYHAEKCFYCYHDGDLQEQRGSSFWQHQEEKVPFCDFICVSWMVNSVGRVMSLLLEYVGQVSLCGKLTKILENCKEWPHIQWTISNPRSLSHLCRVTIRKHLSCKMLGSIQLPTRLRNYLLFVDNDVCSEVIYKEDWGDL